MTNKKTTLEIIAPSVEDAISMGLEQLGISREAVDVEVLDSGSRGLFGIGGRQSRVRLTIKGAGESSPKKGTSTAAMTAPAKDVYSTEEGTGERTSRTASLVLDDDHELQVAQAVVEELLEKMKIRARVTTRFETPPEKGERIIYVEIHGDDLSILIGRRSETLNALQYISSLIICKELGQWMPLMIDIQGYRSRRERQIRQLAHRMAEQAIHTGRRQVLEPMPANERRIVHLELRDNEQVTTESVGEEPNRKVTIYLKK
ncbi:MAG TPA: RNA-binding cell elongation regulator Jag/EloR [Longilinea sp.]|nr:RNA-binding cell elongation regulator Jag/EloR [Longilinea sp.]